MKEKAKSKVKIHNSLLYTLTLQAMNRIMTIVLTMSILVLSSCSNEFKDPNVVADNFLDNLVSLNYEGAMKYATEEFKLQLEVMSSDLAMKSEEDLEASKNATAKITNVESNEEQGTATVSYEDSANPGFPRQLSMTKVEDKWLVDDMGMNDLERMEDLFTEEELEEIMNEEDNEEALPLDAEGEIIE